MKVISLGFAQDVPLLRNGKSPVVSPSFGLGVRKNGKTQSVCAGKKNRISPVVTIEESSTCLLHGLF
jgi:hypothetical protein